MLTYDALSQEENGKHQIYKLFYIFHQKESLEKYNLPRALPANKNNENLLLLINKKNDDNIRYVKKLTGNGENFNPDATNGFVQSFSIIFQSSCATRLTSSPGLSFFVSRYGNFTPTLF